MAEYLHIIEAGDYMRNFFTRVCENSILGMHRNDILNTKLYNGFESSVEQGGATYTYLALSVSYYFQQGLFRMGSEYEGKEEF